MGFFDKLKKMMSGFTFKVNREVLQGYIESAIATATDSSLVDEFFIKAADESSKDLHIMIINYDIKDGFENTFEIEDTYSGVLIFVNNAKLYNAETDRKYRDAASFINSELASYPDEVILRNEMCVPTYLEKYQI